MQKYAFLVTIPVTFRKTVLRKFLCRILNKMNNFVYELKNCYSIFLKKEMLFKKNYRIFSQVNIRVIFKYKDKLKKCILFAISKFKLFHNSIYTSFTAYASIKIVKRSSYHYLEL